MVSITLLICFRNLGLSWDKVLLPREFVDFYLNIVVDTFEFTNVTKTNRPKVFQKSPVSVALTKVRTAYHMFVGGKETTMRDWMHARYKSKLRFANKHYVIFTTVQYSIIGLYNHYFLIKDSKREGRELRVPTFEEEVKQYMKSGKAFKKVSDLKKPHGVRIVQEFPTPCGKPLSIQGIQDVIIRLFQAGYSRPPPINFSMAEIFMQKVLAYQFCPTQTIGHLINMRYDYQPFPGTISGCNWSDGTCCKGNCAEWRDCPAEAIIKETRGTFFSMQVDDTTYLI